jgi:hypothetical protein
VLRAGGGRVAVTDTSAGFVEAVDTTRSQLDPAAVAAAVATARRKSLDELIDELITQPANAAM